MHCKTTKELMQSCKAKTKEKGKTEKGGVKISYPLNSKLGQIFQSPSRAVPLPILLLKQWPYTASRKYKHGLSISISRVCLSSSARGTLQIPLTTASHSACTKQYQNLEKEKTLCSRKEQKMSNKRKDEQTNTMFWFGVFFDKCCARE